MEGTLKVPLRILVVDDEPRIRSTLVQCLAGDGHDVTAMSTAGEAIRASTTEVFDVAILDLRLGSDSGLAVIRPLIESNPQIGVVVITAYATVETAVDAMKLGAADYLAKPFSPAQVRLAVRNAVERKALERQVESLREQLRGTTPDELIESGNEAMRTAIDMARQVANGDATVLLQGESGTGKGVLARAIHEWSPRAAAAFSVAHCPSFSVELFESELFGHIRGAFTGAVRTNAGRVAAADGGTLFLDEIGDLPLAVQPKLLRFIQDRVYERVGDPVERRADVRIVAATNQDLAGSVREHRFREDLFYRLNVVEINIPPLRQRPEDILPLAIGFLSFFANKYGRAVRGFARDAEEVLRRYAWPGNVRELQNAVERAVILSDDSEATIDQVSLRGARSANGPQVGEMVDLRTLEAEHIRRIVETSATLDEAAQTLGIDPSTLWRKRKEHDL